MSNLENIAGRVSAPRILVVLLTLIHYLGKAISFQIHREKKNLDNKSKDLVQNLKSQGYAVLTGYYDNEDCEKIKDEIDRLIQQNPAAISLSDDKSDVRLFAAENFSPLIRRFHDDPFLLGISSGYAQSKIENTSTMAACLSHIENNKGSGGGWHRDSFGSPVKAIMYVSRVTGDTGPFQFVPDSNKPRNIIRDIWCNRLPFLNYRFTEDDVRRIQSEGNYEVQAVTGDPGTVILVDTSAIHRGKPIASGSRYALTNYYSLASKEKKQRSHLNLAKANGAAD